MRRRKSQAEDEQNIKAVIDIGSNAAKLHVAHRQGAHLCHLYDTTEPVLLGKTLESGLMDEEAIRRGVEAVTRLARLAREKGAKPRIVGTMLLRNIRNADEFIRRVWEDTGIGTEVLSEAEEARLVWAGATQGWTGAENVAVFDVGGGSTEFILGTPGPESSIVQSWSAPVGTSHLNEKFFNRDPVRPGAVDSARKHVRKLIAACSFPDAGRPLSVIGLGGGVTALASLKLRLQCFNYTALEGTALTREEVEAQTLLYASSTLAGRMKINGLPAKRAGIVLASSCIVQCALETLGVQAFRVSINGLRHGLLIEMFEKGNDGKSLADSRVTVR
ncbi:MAG: hypothetical protein LBC93_00240 [Synergistaceae bacterium]|jgi:exopolyphosphatase/guanosine-5'-triphosphate,3'-diphosphate pyrophosphatase|nr:hypothetical protein [Synergistaceae bacterium]